MVAVWQHWRSHFVSDVAAWRSLKGNAFAREPGQRVALQPLLFAPSRSAENRVSGASADMRSKCQHESTYIPHRLYGCNKFVVEIAPTQSSPT